MIILEIFSVVDDFCICVTIFTPIYADCWLFGSALIRSSAKIVRSICDSNLLYSFDGSNVNTPICVSALMTAVVMFRYCMSHRVCNGCGVAPAHVIPWPKSWDFRTKLEAWRRKYAVMHEIIEAPLCPLRALAQQAISVLSTFYFRLISVKMHV